MLLSTRPPKIDLFPHGWCIRRADGTIATIQKIRNLGLDASFKIAQERAARMDLSAPPCLNRKKATLVRLPKAQVTLRHRFRGGDKPTAEQWRIFLSFQLSICTKGTGAARRHRWMKVPIGNLHELSPARIATAWRRVYAGWAWATSLKDEHTTEEIYRMPLPENLEDFLLLISLPPPPSIPELWERVGFDPATGRDMAARQKEHFSA